MPVTVLPEVTFLLQTRLGPDAEIAFVRSVADGELTVEGLADDDVTRAADLMATYRDTPLGFVDATVVAQAERLGIVEVLTADRQHFALVRPRHIEAFRLEP